jgi:hypothetical protein
MRRRASRTIVGPSEKAAMLNWRVGYAAKRFSNKLWTIGTAQAWS